MSTPLPSPGGTGSHMHEPEPSFFVEARMKGRVTVLGLMGALTGRNPRILHGFLVKALATRIPPLLLVDVRGLSAIDAGGLAILLGANDHAHASGGRLIVVGTTSGLPSDSELDIRSTFREAMSGLEVS